MKNMLFTIILLHPPLIKPALIERHDWIETRVSRWMNWRVCEREPVERASISVSSIMGDYDSDVSWK